MQGLHFIRPTNTPPVTMGQYFIPVLGSRAPSGEFIPTAWVNPHKFDCGLKFLEHGYTTTSVVSSVMSALRIPADVNPQDHLCKRLVWAGDYEVVPEGQTETYEKTRNLNLFHLYEAKFNLRIKYIVNVSKKEFVDVSKCPFSSDGWKISPLAALTATEMPRGSGDYRGSDSEMVGRWKYDLIYTTTTKAKILKGCKEIFPKFVEGA